MASAETERILHRVKNARDPYETLGIEERQNVTDEMVRKCYLKTSIKVHPDKVPEQFRDQATTAFQQVAASYNLIKNAQARSVYSFNRRTGASASANATANNGFDFHSERQNVQVVQVDLDEAFNMFKEMFSDAVRSRGRANTNMFDHTAAVLEWCNESFYGRQNIDETAGDGAGVSSDSLFSKMALGFRTAGFVVSAATTLYQSVKNEQERERLRREEQEQAHYR